jgi:hypothetical protein
MAAGAAAAAAAVLLLVVALLGLAAWGLLGLLLLLRVLVHVCASPLCRLYPLPLAAIATQCRITTIRVGTGARIVACIASCT